jgi:ubiquitin carboxyl-terminal hydrolase L3
MWSHRTAARRQQRTHHEIYRYLFYLSPILRYFRWLKYVAEPGSDFEDLLKQAIPLKPLARADLLYESKALEAAHQAAAEKGDTTAPSADEKVDLHYVCFVKTSDNNLWELDGRRIGPLKRGQLEPSEDVLSEMALEFGVKSFLKREEEAGGGELRFSLVALGPSFED